MRFFIRFLDVLIVSNTALIAIRVFLKALGANAATPFVDFLYRVTDIILLPFENIFSSPSLGQQGVLDVPALFGTAIYLLAGYFIIYTIKNTTKDLPTPKIFKNKD